MSSNKLAESGGGRQGTAAARGRTLAAWGVRAGALLLCPGGSASQAGSLTPLGVALATGTTASVTVLPMPQQCLVGQGAGFPGQGAAGLGERGTRPAAIGSSRVAVAGRGGTQGGWPPPGPRTAELFGVRCLYHKSLVGTRKQVD